MWSTQRIIAGCGSSCVLPSAWGGSTSARQLSASYCGASRPPLSERGHVLERVTARFSFLLIRWAVREKASLSFRASSPSIFHSKLHSRVRALPLRSCKESSAAASFTLFPRHAADRLSSSASFAAFLRPAFLEGWRLLPRLSSSRTRRSSGRLRS